jgi:hypothetical protein
VESLKKIEYIVISSNDSSPCASPKGLMKTSPEGSLKNPNAMKPSVLPLANLNSAHSVDHMDSVDNENDNFDEKPEDCDPDQAFSDDIDDVCFAHFGASPGPLQLEEERKNKQLGISILECTCTRNLAGERVKPKTTTQKPVPPPQKPADINCTNPSEITGHHTEIPQPYHAPPVEQKMPINPLMNESKLVKSEQSMSTASSETSVVEESNFRTDLITALQHEIDQASSAGSSTVSSRKSSEQRMSHSELMLDEQEILQFPLQQDIKDAFHPCCCCGCCDSDNPCC